tara:strand:+ start:1361 stop:1528 length:168 start_codon:yes stop_codon:yes gene_type:complete
MTTQNPEALKPDYQNAIGRLYGDSRVLGTEELMMFIDALVLRLNDHEARIEALEP